ncbi:efflux RND transporter permease subunit [Fulvivirgaceae bacterium PWU5]|uniref:Efflux RND transporter permease subunit n=1 Tax=Dawidia cretensis TaxID=2782350 RepID=A0AAP2GW24_9BACT|nr:efflux RND transporter permease subunit [Dawidia cretensis]MBT1709977.1 efflux RND transporter permease subunit [Dawidia cretensis]
MRHSSFSVILVFTCLGVLGLSTIPLLNFEFQPNKASRDFTITYEWPGVSPRMLENEVTSKLEAMLVTLKGIQRIASVSGHGTGRIDVQIKSDADPDMLRFEMANLIRQSLAKLPPDLSYPLLTPGSANSSKGPTLTYTLTADASSYYIQDYAQQHILPGLSAIPGVARVDVHGASPYIWEVEFKTDAIERLNIQAQDVATAIDQYLSKRFVGIGQYRSPASHQLQQSPVMLREAGHAALNLAEIPVKKVGNRILYVRDCASVRYVEQTPSSYFRMNGLNTVNIVLATDPTRNTLSAAKRIQAEMHQIETQLPPGYTLTMGSDATNFLRETLRSYAVRIGSSLLLLIAIILLFRRQVRFLFIVMLAVFANVALTSCCFFLFAVPIRFFSLAGLVISLSLMTGNAIIATHAYLRERNNKHIRSLIAFTVIMACILACFTLVDFYQGQGFADLARVIMANLAVSIVTSIFFIPALCDRIAIKPTTRRTLAQKRKTARRAGFFADGIRRIIKARAACIIIAVVSFGIPVYLLPEKMEGSSLLAKLYNQSVGTTWFSHTVKPVLDQLVGGSMRLAIRNGYTGFYAEEPRQKQLIITGQMPEGCTVQQLNDGIERMEQFIRMLKGVQSFQTSVVNYRNSSIVIDFIPGVDVNLPYLLKSQLETRALDLGGITWSVTGVGDGFSNAFMESYKGEQIVLEGYNYEQLYQYAKTLQQMVLTNPRVGEADITSSDNWRSRRTNEFSVDFNKEHLAFKNLRPAELFPSFRERSFRKQIGSWYEDTQIQSIFLTADIRNDFTTWSFYFQPASIKGNSFKMANLGSIQKTKVSDEIYKIDQQYRMVVAYNFLGSSLLARDIKEEFLRRISDQLPLGFKASLPYYGTLKKSNVNLYCLLPALLLAIFFICAIMLESFFEPLLLIMLVPIVFMGSFLSMAAFGIPFNNGVLVSLILLTGLVVYMGLMLLTQSNIPVRKHRKIRHSPVYRCIRTFQYNAHSLVIIILSVSLGLISFVGHGQMEEFWRAMLVSTIGGLLFSFVAFFIYFPLFLCWGTPSKI